MAAAVATVSEFLTTPKEEKCIQHQLQSFPPTSSASQESEKSPYSPTTGHTYLADPAYSHPIVCPAGCPAPTGSINNDPPVEAPGDQLRSPGSKL